MIAWPRPTVAACRRSPPLVGTVAARIRLRRYGHPRQRGSRPPQRPPDMASASTDVLGDAQAYQPDPRRFRGRVTGVLRRLGRQAVKIADSVTPDACCPAPRPHFVIIPSPLEFATTLVAWRWSPPVTAPTSWPRLPRFQRTLPLPQEPRVSAPQAPPPSLQRKTSTCLMTATSLPMPTHWGIHTQRWQPPITGNRISASSAD